MMGLTGKFQFRKTLWGKTVLQIEEEVKPLWSKAGAVKRRWRDATQLDLAAPEMRPLIDMRFKPHLRFLSSFAPEHTSADPEQQEADRVVEAATARPNGDLCRTAHQGLEPEQPNRCEEEWGEPASQGFEP